MAPAGSGRQELMEAMLRESSETAKLRATQHREFLARLDQISQLIGELKLVPLASDTEKGIVERDEPSP